jgi:hypothetical protein
MIESFPLYRIQRQAGDAEMDQYLTNIWRRLTFRPVIKTGRQAYREAFRRLLSEAKRGEVDA